MIDEIYGIIQLNYYSIHSVKSIATRSKNTYGFMACIPSMTSRMKKKIEAFNGRFDLPMTCF